MQIHQFLEFVTNHWELWSMLVIVLIAIIASEFFAKMSRGGTTNPQVLVRLINDEKIVLLDLRAQEIYRKGHIINSINIASDKDIILDKLKTLSHKKETLVVIVCSNGQQSVKTSNELFKAGIENVSILKGGIQAWNTAELPLIEK